MERVKILHFQNDSHNDEVLEATFTSIVLPKFDPVEEKAIVSNIPGTTRDAVDTPFKYDGMNFVAIDTAGIRKSGKIYENIEKYSVLRSMKAIERSDVCVLVINAEEGIIEHDKHIAS